MTAHVSGHCMVEMDGPLWVIRPEYKYHKIIIILTNLRGLENNDCSSLVEEY